MAAQIVYQPLALEVPREWTPTVRLTFRRVSRRRRRRIIIRSTRLLRLIFNGVEIHALRV
jgi:hypothetical protein